MSIMGFIFARGGSKGVPGKNIRPLGGRPLIAWSIDQLLAVPRIDRVIVSTDSEDIADAARLSGAEVPFMRPAELATDTAPEWLAWKHALEFIHANEGRYPEAMVVAPATAPLRTVGDLERCIDEFDRGDADVVITVTDAHRSPYFNMVRIDGGYASLVIPPTGTIARRQDAPSVYDMTTVAYVARPQFVIQSSGLFDGRLRAVHVPVERAIDIDTPLDFRLAELLLAERAP